MKSLVVALFFFIPVPAQADSIAADWFSRCVGPSSDRVFAIYLEGNLDIRDPEQRTRAKENKALLHKHCLRTAISICPASPTPDVCISLLLSEVELFLKQLEDAFPTSRVEAAIAGSTGVFAQRGLQRALDQRLNPDRSAYFCDDTNMARYYDAIVGSRETSCRILHLKLGFNLEQEIASRVLNAEGIQ